MRHLILVDDQEIRKKAFSAIDRLLKKLQRMEANLESFFERDKRLFSEWFDLTFRGRQQELETLRAEYRDLAEFHNWVHALAEMDDLPLTEATVIVREEVRIYKEGTDLDRLQIDERRRLREAYVRAQLERHHQRAQRRRLEEDEEMNGARSRGLDPADLEELEHLNELSDAEIEEWCSDTEVAHMFLGKILRVAGFTGDYHLFFRVWDVLHPKVQKQFSNQFEKKTGTPLFDVIEKMREQVREENAEDEVMNAKPETEVVQPLAPKVETFKLLYRQLARKLHPDMNNADGEADWRKGMWLRVQAAYKIEDTKEMTKLFHLVLLRGREWQALRISELHITHEWLSDEISQTNDYLKDLRRQPAWGFSRRKKFDTIQKKFDRQLAKEKKILEDQVTDLRLHHAFLERMGRASQRRR